MHAFLKTGKLGAGAGGPSSGEGSKKAAVKKALVPWVEKYRPKTVEEVAYQEEVVAVLRKTLEGADLPNLLFYGPPGTGKTSTILAAARQLFGDMFRQRVLELNASDERGIQVVREKIKRFAQTTVSSTRPDGRPCPSFKIVILDEADSMTRPAQAALRRTMEVQSRSTRFCLVCNYVTRIIEPLTSRCSKFRFRPLAQDVLEDRLTTICRSEGVKFEEGVVAAVVETSGGDLRRAITSLQSSARLRGGDVVRVSDVLDVTGTLWGAQEPLRVSRNPLSAQEPSVPREPLSAQGALKCPGTLKCPGKTLGTPRNPCGVPGTLKCPGNPECTEESFKCPEKHQSPSGASWICPDSLGVPGAASEQAGKLCGSLKCFTGSPWECLGKPFEMLWEALGKF
ncbi:hypothetical protein O3P69_011001 [Scylla paramamosain]|uniref:AAA+ ATPase domain-containing protein n=1 Tax=Scylla paramamosain TaxID=85552 RepID=A0AAW0SDN6_SCYPA